MKRTLILTLAMAVLLTATAHAQFFGQFGPLGQSGPGGLSEFGVYTSFASGTSIAATGMVRLGMGKKMDLGIQAGFCKTSNSGPTSFGAQLDSRIDFAHPIQGNDRFKLGADIAAGFSHTGATTVEVFGSSYTTESSNVFMVNGVPCVSISAPAGSGSISGWGGVGIELDAASGNTATSGLIRIGGEFDFSKSMGVVAEWNHLTAGGGGDAFSVGVNFLKSNQYSGSRVKVTPPAKKK